MLELKSTKQTEQEQLKEWHKMSTGVTFYCSGVREEEEKEYDDYAYVAKVIRIDDDNDWTCEDIWNRHQEDAVDHEWAAQKEIFMTHQVFKIIDPSEYPEYFL